MIAMSFSVRGVWSKQVTWAGAYRSADGESCPRDRVASAVICTFLALLQRDIRRVEQLDSRVPGRKSCFQLAGGLASRVSH